MTLDDLPFNGIIIYFQHVFQPPYYSTYPYYACSGDIRSLGW